MATYYRHGDPRFPFIWEVAPQPPARWHAAKDAPASYFADTADGAWAQFLRHEEITDVADLTRIERRVWTVEVPEALVTGAGRPALAPVTLLGGASSYPTCQDEARRLRKLGHVTLLAPSAALLPGTARGQYVSGGLRDAASREGSVLVLFGGNWANLTGWAAVGVGAPAERCLRLVRYLT